ncbi:MAG: Hint domain-containing protein [Candidatus Dormibacteraeota bacterium]|nr:Hint domain-containing protein [Candidatus Dormibacteraeota bacterium]
MNLRLAILLSSLASLAIAACGSAAPAPAPVGSPHSVSELKFGVIDAVGPPVYCDPDFYPIARPDGEKANATAKYPEIQADAEAYSAIVAHEHLPSGEITDEQKLVVYRAWKLLRALNLTPSGADYSFSYRVLSSGGSASYLMVTGTVRVDGVVTVSSRTPTGAPNCPICLAATTLIDTPRGGVPVTDIRPGMVVWTAAVDGTRVAAAVAEVGSTEVPPGHLMVHLVLADGRELLASPGHRTADGRALGSMAVGDALDSSRITRWELVAYGGDRTYDLLPAGATGTYWTNGILLSSTLAHQRPKRPLLPPQAADDR